MSDDLVMQCDVGMSLHSKIQLLYSVDIYMNTLFSATEEPLRV